MKNNKIKYKGEERKNKLLGGGGTEGIGLIGPEPSITLLENQFRGTLGTGGDQQSN